MSEQKIEIAGAAKLLGRKIPAGPRGHILLGNAWEIQRDGVGFNVRMAAGMVTSFVFACFPGRPTWSITPTT